MYRLPVSVMRGGTSKGIYILESDLPRDRGQWDKLFLRLMGSPDKKQIDGLGGSQSVTSKIAVLRASSRSDADVDYTFAQVSVDKPLVSYKGNCGNISSGVGPFAIEKGLVQGMDGVTTVRIFNTNTSKIIVSQVQTPGGRVTYSGSCSIAGVPGTAAPIKLEFLEPAGTLGRGLLPTGSPADILDIPGFAPVQVSIVDAANPLVFVQANALGLRGDELPTEIDGNPTILELLECIRGIAAVKIGLIQDYNQSPWNTPGIPKITIVSRPADYLTSDGQKIAGNSIDLLARMMSMQKTHPSYAMTGAMCTAAAAAIPGSVVQQVLSRYTDPASIRIGHPSGVLECGVRCRTNEEIPHISSAYGLRTANLLLEGTAMVRL